VTSLVEAANPRGPQEATPLRQEAPGGLVAQATEREPPERRTRVSNDGDVPAVPSGADDTARK